MPVSFIQYFTINSPVVQNVPLQLSERDHEVNVLFTTPIKSRPNESTADTSTGTIAKLKNGLNQNSHKFTHSPDHSELNSLESSPSLTAYARPKRGENIT